MKFLWRGVAYEAVDQSDLTWIEMEKLEEATGYTTSEIQEDAKIGGKARVVAAQCWLSVQRNDPEITFADFFGSKLSEFEPQQDDEEQVPPPVVDDPLDSAGTAGSGSEGSGTST